MDQCGLGQSDTNVSLLPDQFNLQVVSSITQQNKMVAVRECLDWIPNLTVVSYRELMGRMESPVFQGSEETR